MKKIVFLVIMLPTLCFGMGKIQPKFSIADQLKLADKVTGLESNIKALNAKVDGQLAVVAGVNNQIKKVSTDIRSGRDTVTSTTNDTRIFDIQKDMYLEQIKVWKYLFYAVVVLIVSPLLGLISWVIKAMFKEQSNRTFYQIELGKMSKNGEFDEIMKRKREYDNRKKKKKEKPNVQETVSDPDRLANS
jgi:hypothetical protein